MVQFQNDSFKSESEHVFLWLRAPQGSLCQSTNPSPFLDPKAFAWAVPSAWNSSPNRAHSILKSLLKRPLSKGFPDHPVKLHPLYPLLLPVLPVLPHPALVFPFFHGTYNLIYYAIHVLYFLLSVLLTRMSAPGGREHCPVHWCLSSAWNSAGHTQPLGEHFFQ